MDTHSFSIRHLLTSALALLLAALSPMALADSLIVTTTTDVVDANDGQTSLRVAITHAASLGGPQTITFSNTTDDGATDFYDGDIHTILINSTFVIASDVTIEGSGASLAHNLIGDDDGITGGLDASDLIDPAPLLGSLADNGGPTRTNALLDGSSAIDAGDNTLALDWDGNPLTTDQRGTGFPRITPDTQGRLVIQFVRRKAAINPVISYTVQTGEDLTNLQPLDLDGALTESIDPTPPWSASLSPIPSPPRNVSVACVS